MLVTLRKTANSWLVKGLLLLLVGSFGIWGISSSLVSSTPDAVIQVGDQTVKVNEFQLAYKRELADLSRRFGTQITAEQARSLGVEQQVYSQLTAGAALDQLASDMKLGLSKDKLAQLLAEDPAFQNANGQFDRQLFTSRLQNAGIRENDYIAERSKVALRSQIVDAVASGFTGPKVLVDALTLYRQETRSVDYLLLTAANIEPIQAPDEKTLQTWFDTVKFRYRAPEYRSFNYVTLEPRDLADAKAITDDEIKKEYESHLQAYEVQGSRTIEQLTFKTKELADAAEKQLQSGAKTFDQLIADQGKSKSDVLLGDFTKAQLPDQTLAAAAFAVTKDGDVTPVVDGAFGPVILRISNIKPSHTKSLDEVKDQIRADLAAAAAADKVNAVHDKFEDLRNSGATLAEAAEKTGLKLVKVDSIDSHGSDNHDKPVLLPDSPDLLKTVFTTEIGSEPLPLNLGRSGYVWFEVTKIDPSRDRTLSEVKDRATADWMNEQRKQALTAKAEALKTEMEHGKSLADIAAETKLTIQTKDGIRRDTKDQLFGQAAIRAIFQGGVGAVGATAGEEPMTAILYKVKTVDTHPKTDVLGQDKQQIVAFANAAGDDILDEMVNQLQSKYGVKLNQSLAQQAMIR
ncbi:SurA N-terminal domain-containing protein [Allorhizobium sp. BGMRC 0089]|uniref:peptidylprolyl isomerase n=1 Tax=Allorhizobium sonneratiae TaxID=2934936 RepID=UPI002033F553|nr:peptidylprolyl isomerase [Allorhizobium sonneratiae]MCM2293741.1 SurA N-terminal domain-containing protein [Allorhizobium sonneratiae]